MNTQLQESFSETSVVQYLTFQLDNEAFATEISKVREVLEYTKITRVPRTPGFMRGVINLRGSVVPVIDLRMQFGMPAGKRTVDTCIIILEVIIEDKTTVIGALADSVQEVVDLDADQISEAPALGTRIDNQYISSMGRVDDRFVMILDLDKIFKIDPDAFTQCTYDYDEGYAVEPEVNNNETQQIKLNSKQTIVDAKAEVLNSKSEVPDINIDLDSAIQKHAQWKLKLHTAITKKETLVVEEVSRDDCCVLGNWLYGEAKSKFYHLASYLDCRDKHKNFHIEAGKVAQYINDKKYKQAETMLGTGSVYAQASSSVAAAIIALRKEL